MHHLDFYTAEKNIFLSNDHTFKSFEYAATFKGNYRFIRGSSKNCDELLENVSNFLSDKQFYGNKWWAYDIV